MLIPSLGKCEVLGWVEKKSIKRKEVEILVYK